MLSSLQIFGVFLCTPTIFLSSSRPATAVLASLFSLIGVLGVQKSKKELTLFFTWLCCCVLSNKYWGRLFVDFFVLCLSTPSSYYYPLFISSHFNKIVSLILLIRTMIFCSSTIFDYGSVPRKKRPCKTQPLTFYHLIRRYRRSAWTEERILLQRWSSAWSGCWWTDRKYPWRGHLRCHR